MEKVIRIGTRNSELALWQAHLVQKSLEKLGHKGEIVEVSSTGDEILDIPLHQIGGMGLFTKTLDVAMLRGQVDIAVHSLKDVPTQLPETIVQAAVLERAHVQDVLVYKDNLDFFRDFKRSCCYRKFAKKSAMVAQIPNTYFDRFAWKC